MEAVEPSQARLEWSDVAFSAGVERANRDQAEIDRETARSHRDPGLG
jgi:hypothetical protein